MDRGSGCIVAIGKQSAYETAVADTLLLAFSSETLKSSPKKSTEENLLCGKSPAALDLQSISVAGDITGVLKPENAGFLLKAALGGTDTVVLDYGTVTGQDQHTIVAVDSDGVLPCYSIRANRKVDTKLYTGCTCNSLKLSAKAGDYVKVTSSWKGYTETAAATITTTLRPVLKAFKFLGATVTVGGSSVEFTGFELGINNNCDDGVQTSATGTGFSQPVHDTREITITLDVPYTTATDTLYETYAKGEGVVTVVLHFESPSLIAGTSKYRVDVTLNNCALLGDPANVSGKDILAHTLKFQATEVGSTEPISAVIYDAQDAAY